MQIDYTHAHGMTRLFAAYISPRQHYIKSSLVHQTVQRCFCSQKNTLAGQ